MLAASPKSVANTEDSEGEHGEVPLGPYSRGHRAEHTQGSRDLLTTLGVVCSANPAAMVQWMRHTVGRGSWSFSAIQTANMVPRKGAEDFPVASRCANCHARASARDCSAYKSPARPMPLSSRARVKRVLSAHCRSARARGSAAKCATHESQTRLAAPWSSAAVPRPNQPPPPGCARGGRSPGGGGGTPPQQKGCRGGAHGSGAGCAPAGQGWNDECMPLHLTHG